MRHERDVGETGPRETQRTVAMAVSDSVEDFNRELRAWVKNNTGGSIGALKDPRVPKSTIYRHTQGSNLLSRDELKDLVTVCTPKDLRGIERDEWIAAEFRGWYERWRSVENISRVGLDVREDVDRSDDDPVQGSATQDLGLRAAMRLVDEKVAQAEKRLRASHQSAMLAREIIRELNDVAEFVEHATNGRIVSDGTNLRDLIYQTRACMVSMHATTTVTAAAVRDGQSWWDSLGARAYLEENKQAIARGVAVHRVFIVDDYEAAAPLIESHVNLGVKASWVHASSLAPSHRSNVLVWDGRIGWRALMGTLGEVSQNWLYTNEDDVRRLEKIYDACNDLAVFL